VIEWQKSKTAFAFRSSFSSPQSKLEPSASPPLTRNEWQLRWALPRLVARHRCGTNELARRYRSRQGLAIGVDIHPWPGTDVVCDTTRLPFPDGYFDTVLMLACLNHVPQSKRIQVCRKPGGFSRARGNC